ncbi:MAG: glutamine phosphoribosylpyrophosphate amidotransferase [Acidobacteria bacterium]|nr:MAG: glutamine phosphoribosylpyrophosphate amidotransferase [Acidobacteriota bacterium]
MCGIVGFLSTNGDGQAETGRTILGMLRALGCRGPDSAGVALFGAPNDNRFAVRVKLGEGGDLQSKARQIAVHLEALNGASQFSTTGAYARFLVSGETDIKQLADSIESLDKDYEVVSIGRRLEIIKQTGSPENLEKTYCVSHLKGTHGLGHTRLSTESRVDLSHSQPFWSHGFPDLAIVHNGHITNYHQLRRRYEQRGIRFYTENDSEVVAIYLAEQLAKGGSLQEALELMLRDLDGSYSCLAATERQLGFVKDPFALKPLVMTETEQFVAVATEEIAIRAAIAGTYSVREAQVKEVRVWQR